MHGWAGTILHVDLTRRKVWKKPLDRDLCGKFLGSRGISAKLLFDLMKPGIDAYDPENLLIFGTGPLIGTAAPSAGRVSVTCKGAMTNLYLKTGMGGRWGSELKFAGYDHIVLYGASKEPAYLWIDDENVELREAKDLWGMDVRQTNETIKKDLDDRGIKVACIGPAGENLVRYANILNTEYHSASRGGAGAVMGSKKLKAIAIRGTGDISVQNPDRFNETVLRFVDAIERDAHLSFLHDYGTAGTMETANLMHVFPTKNYQLGHTDNQWPLTGQCFVREGYLARREACSGCSVACIRYNTIDSGPYSGTYTCGPQYETVVKLGSGTCVFDTAAVIKAHALCNQYGLDASSTGSAIQWAMESYEKRVLTKEDCDGLELTFGNAEALIKLIPMIAHKEGRIGSLLAEGSARAARRVGKGSWKWSLHNSKGLEISAVDLRGTWGYALAFAVNPRGPDHLMTETVTDFALTDEAIEFVAKITGDRKYAKPAIWEKKPEVVRWHEDVYAITDALGLCVFYSTASYVLTPQIMAELFSYATGIETTEDQIMLSGRRIVTVEKCYNVREGADRKLDDLPYRMTHEPAPAGPPKGLNITPEILDKMLDGYYSLHEWDAATSWPYAQTLKKLELQDVADELAKVKKLPKRPRKLKAHKA